MDIPKALFIHETLGIALLGGAWASCYHLEPTRRGLAAFGFASAAMTDAMQRAKTKFGRWSSWTSRVALLRHADQARLVVSLAESSVARKLVAPATVPLKIWASCYMVLLARGGGGGAHERSSTDNSSNDDCARSM